MKATKVPYRDVADTILKQFEDPNTRTVKVTKKIGIINYTFTISRCLGEYTLRKGETILGTKGTARNIITMMLDDWNLN